jgi:CubicO group peptidase (beta-lactamase class C family)
MPRCDVMCQCQNPDETRAMAYRAGLLSSRTIRSLLAMMLAAGLTNMLSAQQSSFPAAFDAFVHADGTVGAAYIVLDQGRIADSRSYGMADSSLKQAVDKNTIFHWGSITKTLTAVCIMQLRDRGKLSLDDPILKYVPELARVHSEDNGIARVTIRHLLSHTAGFQGPTWPYKNGKPWEPFEPTEWSQLVAMMPYQELAFAPGAKFSYSNPAFVYLARVVEVVTGDPFQVYVQKNILTPLGMTRTFYNVSPYHLAADRADSYEILTDAQGRETTRAFEREFNTGITTPNGGLNAPLEDMAKWISFLAGTNTTPGASAILDRKSLEEMWLPVVQVTEDYYVAPPVAMGLSFFLYPRGDVTLVGHTGHQAGFAATFVLNPKNGRAVIAVFNTIHSWGESEASHKAATNSAARLGTMMERANDAVR